MANSGSTSARHEEGSTSPSRPPPQSLCKPSQGRYGRARLNNADEPWGGNGDAIRCPSGLVGRDGDHAGAVPAGHLAELAAGAQRPVGTGAGLLPVLAVADRGGLLADPAGWRLAHA